MRTPLNDIMIPLDLLQGLGDDDECLHGATAMGVAAEAEDELRLGEAQAGGDDGGRVEDGLSMTYRGHTHVFNSVPPHNKNKVHPIVVPQDFDRAAAISRYRKKRKIIVKADYSVRREIASSCANCGESSEVTPKMRRGPNVAKNFCNACSLAWANTGKIRKLTNCGIPAQRSPPVSEVASTPT